MTLAIKPNKILYMLRSVLDQLCKCAWLGKTTNCMPIIKFVWGALYKDYIDIEEQLNKVYKLVNFKNFKTNYFQLVCIVRKKITDDGATSVWMEVIIVVRKFLGPSREVVCDASIPKAWCLCCMSEGYGIPFKHVVLVFWDCLVWINFLNTILTRWTKIAKSSIDGPEMGAI